MARMQRYARAIRMALTAVLALSIGASTAVGFKPEQAHAALATVTWVETGDWMGPVPGLTTAARLACNLDLDSERANWRRGLAARLGIPEASVSVLGNCEYQEVSVGVSNIGLGLTFYRVVLQITCPCGQRPTIYGGPGRTVPRDVDPRNVRMR